VERGAGTDVAGDRRGQRLEQERRLADPVGERGTFELDAGPAVDHALPVQGQVIGILRHQDMGEQARPRPAARDRQRRRRHLRDRLARPAAHPRPDVHHHLEVRGHVFEHLALVLAEPAQAGAAARRADAGRVVHHALARQHGRTKACPLWSRADERE